MSTSLILKNSAFPKSLNLQHHPFHLVTPSPWPILVSILLTQTVLGLVLSMHQSELFSDIPNFFFWSGLSFVSYALYCWFTDIIEESFYEGNHTKKVETSLRLGMGLFIVSEIMFFFSIFWAFFHSSLSPSIAIGLVWPPLGIQSLNPFGIPLLNTAILLTSGITLTLAHRSLIVSSYRVIPNIPTWKKFFVQDEHNKGLFCWLYKNKMSSLNFLNSFKTRWIYNFKAANEAKLALAFTIFLGVWFTIFQFLEYNDASFNISDSVYGSCFYLATGFHGIHVFVGTVFLLVCYIRMLLENLKADRHFGFLAAIWYWHFVDVVWLFLYLIVYCWGGNTPLF